MSPRTSPRTNPRGPVPLPGEEHLTNAYEEVEIDAEAAHGLSEPVLAASPVVMGGTGIGGQSSRRPPTSTTAATTLLHTTHTSHGNRPQVQSRRDPNDDTDADADAEDDDNNDNNEDDISIRPGDDSEIEAEIDTTAAAGAHALRKEDFSELEKAFGFFSLSSADPELASALRRVDALSERREKTRTRVAGSRGDLHIQKQKQSQRMGKHEARGDPIPATGNSTQPRAAVSGLASPVQFNDKDKTKGHLKGSQTVSNDSEETDEVDQRDFSDYEDMDESQIAEFLRRQAEAALAQARVKMQKQAGAEGRISSGVAGKDAVRGLERASTPTETMDARAYEEELGALGSVAIPASSIAITRTVDFDFLPMRKPSDYESSDGGAAYLPPDSEPDSEIDELIGINTKPPSTSSLQDSPSMHSTQVSHELQPPRSAGQAFPPSGFSTPGSVSPSISRSTPVPFHLLASTFAQVLAEKFGSKPDVVAKEYDRNRTEKELRKWRERKAELRHQTFTNAGASSVSPPSVDRSGAEQSFSDLDLSKSAPSPRSGEPQKSVTQSYHIYLEEDSGDEIPPEIALQRLELDALRPLSRQKPPQESLHLLQGTPDTLFAPSIQEENPRSASASTTGESVTSKPFLGAWSLPNSGVQADSDSEGSEYKGLGVLTHDESGFIDEGDREHAHFTGVSRDRVPSAGKRIVKTWDEEEIDEERRKAMSNTEDDDDDYEIDINQLSLAAIASGQHSSRRQPSQRKHSQEKLSPKMTPTTLAHSHAPRFTLNQGSSYLLPQTRNTLKITSKPEATPETLPRTNSQSIPRAPPHPSQSVRYWIGDSPKTEGRRPSSASNRPADLSLATSGPSSSTARIPLPVRPIVIDGATHHRPGSSHANPSASLLTARLGSIHGSTNAAIAATVTTSPYNSLTASVYARLLPYADPHYDAQHPGSQSAAKNSSPIMSRPKTAFVESTTPARQQYASSANLTAKGIVQTGILKAPDVPVDATATHSKKAVLRRPGTSPASSPFSPSVATRTDNKSTQPKSTGSQPGSIPRYPNLGLNFPALASVMNAAHPNGMRRASMSSSGQQESNSSSGGSVKSSANPSGGPASMASTPGRADRRKSSTSGVSILAPQVYRVDKPADEEEAIESQAALALLQVRGLATGTHRPSTPKQHTGSKVGSHIPAYYSSITQTGLSMRLGSMVRTASGHSSSSPRDNPVSESR